MNVIQLRIKLAHLLLRIPIIRTIGEKLKILPLLIPNLKQSIAMSTHYGFNILIDPELLGVEQALYSSGSYERGTLTVIKNVLRENDVFIDIGSNIGFITLFASRLVGPKGRVFSFEPEPSIFAQLQKNLKLNRIKNVRAKNLALGSEKIKQSKIYPYINRKNATLMKLENLNSNGVQVNISTLDKFIDKSNISNIKMIKIDVEGWELEVLKGAQMLLSSKKAPIICIEYTSFHPILGGQNLDIFNYLTSINDYQIFKLKEGKEKTSKLVKISSSKDLPQHDNLFCFLPIHLKNHQDMIV